MSLPRLLEARRSCSKAERGSSSIGKNVLVWLLPLNYVRGGVEGCFNMLAYNWQCLFSLLQSEGTDRYVTGHLCS